VLRGISLEVAPHELFFLLGPSGCGKTTLLRLIAGFYQPDEGEVFFGERCMNGVPPHRRNTGMVFQNYALWPHLTVAENVGYGLEVRGVPRAERARRVAEALATVQMQDYADRTPNQLSGGQQQRVALARALVIRPDVLLLDEPLSNLDARLRLEMREEIRRIHDQTRITTIYVTHDQKESLSMADRLAVLRDGAVEQVGDPRTVYRAPATRFVADFIGETNWLPATVLAAGPNGLRLQSDFGVLVAATVGGAGSSRALLGPQSDAGALEAEASLALKPGDAVWVGFRPEAVRIGPGEVNALPTRIRKVTYLGEIEQYLLELEGGLKLKAFEQNPLEIRQPGAALPVQVRPEDVFVLPREV
jgi:iron(III) transport system ATP-binding protein